MIWLSQQCLMWPMGALFRGERQRCSKKVACDNADVSDEYQWLYNRFYGNAIQEQINQMTNTRLRCLTTFNCKRNGRYHVDKILESDIAADGASLLPTLQ